MRSYKVKGQDHYIYDLESELPENIHPIKNWRDGLPGDWVLADDNSYVQILERKKIGKSDALRTCVGTYMVTQSMDTAERDSRYTINGKLDRNTVQERKKPTDKEVIFASKIVRGVDAVKMLWEAFGVVTQKKVTEIAGIFQGFEPAQLKEVERPSLPEHQTTGDEVI
jgi:hypothetical protein